MTMKQNSTPHCRRIIGLDVHPDSFTAAIVSGSSPGDAHVLKTFNKVPLKELSSWAKKYSLAEDTLVLEASGNSFHVVRLLEQIQRTALVLESAFVGKLKEAHANNDKISAVRIAKAYLAGTAKIVWVPDPFTQERRDTFHAYRKATKRSTQLINRYKSYLSDHGVRLTSQRSLLDQQGAILNAADWSPREEQVIKGLHLELQHAQEQRSHWRSLMAQEVLTDPKLLSLTRLTGIRDVVAYALGAMIGDIKRFATAKKLVAYVGLNPAFDDSGEGSWKGGIRGHGRRDLRSLLIESAHSILRSKHPLAKWGKQLMARKGSKNLAVAAIARKLVVAVWYLMKGKESPVEELTPSMSLKLGKIISQLSPEGIQTLGPTRKALRAQVTDRLLKAKTYLLDPNKTFEPQPG